MPEPADPLSVPCAACLAPAGEGCYSVSSDEPRPAPHRLRTLAAAQHLKRCEACAAVGWVPDEQPAEPVGDLHERLATALYRRLREQVGPDAGSQIRAEAKADDLVNAVLPVVEAETAALRERAENAEDRLRKATDAYTRLHAATTGTEATGDRWRQRAEEAERALAQARDAIADERKGRLAAEAAVRRARAVVDEALPDWEDTRAYHRERADRKGYSHDEAVAETSERAIKVMTDVLAALGAEQPEKPRNGTWTVAVQVPTHLPDAMKDGLFTAVADAVSEWEPADRDGWDPYVTGYTEQSKESP